MTKDLQEELIQAIKHEDFALWERNNDEDMLAISKIALRKPMKCELCDKKITEETDNPNRCYDCYEEWRDEWPDRI